MSSWRMGVSEKMIILQRNATNDLYLGCYTKNLLYNHLNGVLYGKEFG